MATTQTNPLQPIEQPPNQDGTQLGEFPPMREAMLTLPDLNSFLADIEQLTSNVTLMLRANHSSCDNSTVRDPSHRFKLTRTALDSGQTMRMQSRYHWQSNFWIDTLEKQVCGFRLIRIAHQPAFATGFKDGNASHD